MKAPPVRYPPDTGCVSAQPDYMRNYHLKSKYGLTSDDYEEMLIHQDGKCAVCLKPETRQGRRLSVHHDHVTSRVIALLCARCNMALGHFNDDPALLRRAAALMED